MQEVDVGGGLKDYCLVFCQGTARIILELNDMTCGHLGSVVFNMV